MSVQPTHMPHSVRPQSGSARCLGAVLVPVLLLAAVATVLAQTPASSSAKTSTKISEMTDEWGKKVFLEAYKTKGKHDPKWDDQAVAFLGSFRENYQDEEERAKQAVVARQILVAGCDDPTVCRCAVHTLLAASDSPTEVYPWIRKARLLATSDSCPSIVRFLVLTDLVQALGDEVLEPEFMELELGGKGREAMGKNTAEALANAVAEGVFSGNEIRVAYRLAMKEPNRLGDVVAALDAHPGTSKWLRNALQGHFLIAQAWRARSHDFANKVTEKGWEGFHRNLAAAREPLLAAWAERQDCPEPAVDMMVARGEGGAKDESGRTWFDRAIQADVWSSDAYDYLSNGLRPRWGGTPEKMYALGMECLRSGRYDSDMPLYYAEVLRRVAQEKPVLQWRQLYRTKEVQSNLDELFTNVAEKSKHHTAVDRRHLLAWRIATMAWGGRHQEAKAMLGGIDGPIDSQYSFLGGAMFCNYQDWSEIAAEVDAFTGPYGDRLKEAEAVYETGDFVKATPLFRAILQQADDPKVRLTAANRLGWLAVAERTASQPADFIPNDNCVLACLVHFQMTQQIDQIVKNGGGMLLPGGNAVSLLHWACLKMSEKQVLDYLQCEGAKPVLDLKNNSGVSTPLAIAMGRKFTTAAAKMKEMGANPRVVQSILIDVSATASENTPHP